MLSLFAYAIGVGLMVAIPPGPLGLICIHYSLRGGMRLGLIAGAGISSADAVFGFLGVLGVAATVQSWGDPCIFQLVGAFLILLIGIKIVFSSPPSEATIPSANDYMKAFTNTFLLTIIDPFTIVYFASIFASTGLGLTNGTLITPIILAIGIFVGSGLWWIVLSWLSVTFGKKINLANSSVLCRISGIFLIALAMISIAKTSGLSSTSVSEHPVYLSDSSTESSHEEITTVFESST